MKTYSELRIKLLREFKALWLKSSSTATLYAGNSMKKIDYRKLATNALAIAIII